MKPIPAKARSAAAPQPIRALTYEAYLARERRAADMRAAKVMDALLADLFALCQGLDRAIDRRLNALVALFTKRR